MPTPSSADHPSGFRPVAETPGMSAVKLSAHTQAFDVLDPRDDGPRPTKKAPRFKAVKRAD